MENDVRLVLAGIAIVVGIVAGAASVAFSFGVAPAFGFAGCAFGFIAWRLMLGNKQEPRK